MNRQQAEKQAKELNKRFPSRCHFPVMTENNNWKVDWKWRQKG